MHSKVEPPSVAVNANDAFVAEVVPVGPDAIVVSGAVVSGAGAVSTVKGRVAGDASVLPATSVARTETEWAPSPAPGRPRARASAQEPASTRHSNTELASLA